MTVVCLFIGSVLALFSPDKRQYHTNMLRAIRMRHYHRWEVLNKGLVGILYQTRKAYQFESLLFVLFLRKLHHLRGILEVSRAQNPFKG